MKKLKLFLLSRKWVILCAATIISLSVYLISSYLFYKIGFPLDDSWIHQTFARNLATLGEWSFNPGTPSAGSTSPLWSTILAFGYILKLGPYIWTFFLGGICLFVSGYISERIYNNLYPSNKNLLPIVGLLTVLEWHLLWVSVSGMETILFILACLLLFWVINSSSKWTWLLSGLIIGASVWIRPEGLTLASVVFFVEAFSNGKIIDRIRRIGATFLGIALFVIPYFLFNSIITGSIFPNTFFAKQAEYAILLQTNLFIRFINLLSLPFNGVGIFLVPGFIYHLYLSIKSKKFVEIGMYLWFIGFIVLYTLRLPVVYQHGRYLIPTIPVMIFLGGVGTIEFIDFIKIKRFGFVISTSVKWAIGLLLVGFIIIGARTYDLDVAIIETEMVTPAKWISDNTPRNSLIAAHDIGALGFFGDRQILDLAGLISPDVIPSIRDEPKLKIFIESRKANFLMTFPDWYPDLVSGKNKIYSSNGQFSISSGGTNMAIYKLIP